MIILKKLSSQKKLFDTITFKKGINIIQGVSSKQQVKKDANGVGKSSIVRLVDFCLGANNSVFKANKYKFLFQDTIILELTINDKDYIIKRNFENKFLLTEENKKEQGFTLDEIKNILSRKFFPQRNNINLPEGVFRNLIKFFIKDDISKIKQYSSYKFEAKARETDLYWFNLNLYLMGIENNLYITYDDNEKKLKKYKKEIIDYKKSLKEKSKKEYEDIEGGLKTIKNEIEQLKKALNDYNYTSFKDIEEKIISIGKELAEQYETWRATKRDIDNLNKSLVYEVGIELDDIEKQYTEIKKVFADIVTKELQSVITFNKQIRDNRTRFLRNYLSDLEDKKKATWNKINKLEKERANLISINLNDKDKKFIQEKIQYLVTQLAEKADIEAQLELIEKAREEFHKYNTQKAQLKQNMASQNTNRTEKTKQIQEIFNENFKLLLTNNINEAKFNIISNTTDEKILNIDFHTPQQESRGNYAYSFLIYDISLFFYLVQSGNNNLPHFLFHDGIFGEGIFTDKLIAFINNINNKLKDYEFQYIITLNEDNVEDNKKNKFNFNFDEQIILKLNQKKTLFKRTF